MKLYKSLTTALKEREQVYALKITIKSDAFPEELSDFPNLTELYLEGECKTFDPNFSSKNLKTLAIKFPFFEHDISSVFKLPHLTNLKIIDTPLKRILLPLGHLPAPLKSLTLKDCKLEMLPEEFSILSTLNELNLSGNKLTALPVSFTELTYLKRLNLDHNDFKKFPDLIKKMTNLSHLSIDQNLFPEEEKERIQREYHIWPN